MGLSLKQFMIECTVFRSKRKLPLIATISPSEREKIFQTILKEIAKKILELEKLARE